MTCYNEHCIFFLSRDCVGQRAIELTCAVPGEDKSDSSAAGVADTTDVVRLVNRKQRCTYPISCVRCLYSECVARRVCSVLGCNPSYVLCAVSACCFGMKAPISARIVVGIIPKRCSACSSELQGSSSAALGSKFPNPPSQIIGGERPGTRLHHNPMLQCSQPMPGAVRL